MGVFKNRGTPKWMVIMENPIKMDDLGVPLFSETSILLIVEMINVYALSQKICRDKRTNSILVWFKLTKNPSAYSSFTVAAAYCYCLKYSFYHFVSIWV